MKNAYYRKIPCYFDDKTSELIGRNVYWELLLQMTLWFDVQIINIEEFPIYIEEENNK